MTSFCFAAGDRPRCRSSGSCSADGSLRDTGCLFTNWPANRAPRDKLVPLSMRTGLRHIGDGIELAGLDEESPGTGRRRAGAHSLRHSAARHWLMVGRVPLNVVLAWLGHANAQVTLRIYLPIVGSDYSMDAVP